MSKPELNVVQVAETRFSLEVNHTDLVSMLRQAGHQVPCDARIFVNIMGGRNGRTISGTQELFDGAVQVQWTKQLDNGNP